eukprot:c7410_g1_i1.p1 GENE.c7410_g1_i1~~c7410_g1_i1.p1  ORF type:complete len:352 (+),score=136.63 c7410_g1_i1:24-1079(+)
MSNVKQISLALCGFGTVNQLLCSLLIEKKEEILNGHGIEFIVRVVLDSKGGVACVNGLNYSELLNHKRSKQSVNSFQPNVNEIIHSDNKLELLKQFDYDILVEASIVNLKDGGDALKYSKQALENGKSLVLANKGPLVCDFDGLHELAKQKNSHIAFSATTCGGLPVVNVGKRDLLVAKFTKVEGVFNSTTNFILSQLAKGETFETALKEAQQIGVAEADPSLDVDGWDTAFKLYIIMRSVCSYKCSLSDISITGVSKVTPEELSSANKNGNTVKLVAKAELDPSGKSYALSVRPEVVPNTSFIGGIKGWEMGVRFSTDIFSSIEMKIDEKAPLATAAAVLRDLIHTGKML